MKRIRLIEEADNILYLSGNGNYTNVHYANARSVLLPRTIHLCAAELPHFVRIHKKYAVNPQYVADSKMINPKMAEVLTGAVWLPVSRRRLRDVMNLLQPDPQDKEV